MSFTFGFFDNIDGLPTYNANDFNNILGGLVSDGIFTKSIINGSIANNQFLKVAKTSDLVYIVRPGKARFNDIWLINDANYSVTISDIAANTSRYTDIVIEINKNVKVRTASIKAVNGTAKASGATRPTLSKSNYIYQYPLATILLTRDASTLTTKLTNLVGTGECPYVTNILKMPTLSFVNNLTATASGKALDARQGKVLDDKITALNNNINSLNSNIDTLNSNVTKLTNTVTSMTKTFDASLTVKLAISSDKYGYMENGTFVPF